MKIQNFNSFNENNSESSPLSDILENDGISVKCEFKKIMFNGRIETKVEINLDAETKSNDLISEIIEEDEYGISLKANINFFIHILNENNPTLKRIQKLCDLVLVHIRENTDIYDSPGLFLYFESPTGFNMDLVNSKL